MIEHLKSLKAADYQTLKDAVPLITILIAGADGKIEVGQLEWAQKITKIRSYKMEEELADFYKEVGIDFQDKLDDILRTYPMDVKERTQLLSEKLKEVNPVLAKLEPEIASKVYKSFTSFARHVAQASGGFLGFFSINEHEAKLIGLPMITPVVYSNEEEEE
ncbi:MAG: hypothetical protein IPM26_03230 [Saprospiraceae bacterium]|nr:hypothetical protein [Saprospiraceae bacterium]